jgi:Chromo (CHRromatin Organisation MOdifier) domain
LTPALNDPIANRHIPPPPLPEIIEGEEEWVVEEILDSKVINRKLRYLVKWKDFGIEHNSWEPWDNVHAPDLVADFHRKYPGAARRIRTAEFHSIPFRPLPAPIVPGRHFLKGGVDVRGHPVLAPDPTPDSSSIGVGSMPRLVVQTCQASPRYIPPHRRFTAPTPDSLPISHSRPIPITR